MFFVTSQIVFSYLWEQLVPFTRDTDAIKSALNTVGDYSKTCLEPFLAGISGLIVEEFGGTTPVQVVFSILTNKVINYALQLVLYL